MDISIHPKRCRSATTICALNDVRTILRQTRNNSLFFVGFMCVLVAFSFYSCADHKKPQPLSPDLIPDTVSLEGKHQPKEDVSNKIWTSLVVDLWAEFMSHGKPKRTQIINPVRANLHVAKMVHFDGELYAMSYSQSNDVFAMQYSLDGNSWVTSIWYENDLVLLEEPCFNFAWGRCGIGFNRRAIYRRGEAIDQSWRRVVPLSQLEFESDPCNCLNTLNVQRMRELKKRCWAQIESH
jgi:hypothetical protein